MWYVVYAATHVDDLLQPLLAAVLIEVGMNRVCTDPLKETRSL